MFSEALWALLLLSSSFDKWLCCRAEREEGRRKITYKKRRMGCADSHIHLEGIRKRVLKSRTPSKKGRSGFQHFLQAPAQTRPARLSTFSAPNPNMLESPWPQDLLSLQTRVERDLFPAGSRAQDAGLGISQSTEQSRGKLSRAHPLSLRLRGRRDKNSSAAFRRCQ
uniref:Uncharacterized protein LOC110221486 isoform X6 n=1 Tax=Phascolarctos cinereus TaxID=38626 RepID=A0A6P5M014_PHACI|nr:uncharacterized protein LOC110221486 isoform X6 [Phascolarctos cinereus]